MAKNDPQVIEEFDEAVNMKPEELEEWLATEESKSVGQGTGESKSHQMGCGIIEILRKKDSEYIEDDLDHMRQVTSYVHRHKAQEPKDEDIESSKWRYSLMNWGHDPLK